MSFFRRGTQEKVRLDRLWNRKFDRATSGAPAQSGIAGPVTVHTHLGTGQGGTLTGYQSLTTATVSTTDATVTTLATIAAPATTTMHIHARVVARRTGGVLGTAEDGAGYDIEATVKNVAGTATLIGAVVSLSTQEDQALWDATIDVSGGNARIRVTGAAQNNINWKAQYSMLQVS